VDEAFGIPLARPADIPSGHHTEGCGRVLNQVSPLSDPGHSRGQEGGGSVELFAATSFGRSRLGAPSGPTSFQRRGCGQPSGLLSLRAAFTEPCRPSDVSVVTRRHARPALFGGFFNSAFADRCAVRDTLLADGATEIDLRARGLPLRHTGESETGKSPETPSVVLGPRKPKPANRMSANF
jgi:hypothetical protein